MSTTPDSRTHWTIDRRLPVTILLALAGHLGGTIWWARGLTSDVAVLKDKDIQHDIAIKEIRDQRERERVPERLATLETEFKNQTILLRRIDERTERLVRPGR